MRTLIGPAVFSLSTLAALLVGGASPASAVNIELGRGPIIAVGATPVTLAANPVSNRVFVSDLIDTAIRVLDATTGAVVGPGVNIGANAQVGMAVNPSTNRVFVTSYASGSVVVLDGTTGVPIGSPVLLGGTPLAIVVNSATNRVFVADRFTSSVHVLDGLTGAPIGAPVLVPCGVRGGVTEQTSRNMVATATRVWVSDFFNECYTELDGTTGAVIGAPHLTAIGPSALAASQDRNELYISNFDIGQIAIVDAASGAAKLPPVVVGARATTLVYDPVRELVYVSNHSDTQLKVVDPSSGTVTSSLSVPEGAGALALLADTGRLFALHLNDNKAEMFFVNVSPKITSTDPAEGTVGEKYSLGFAATGTPQPNLTISGSVPPGLTFDAVTATLSGTPRQAGSFAVTVSGTNGVTPDVDASATYTITIRPSALVNPAGVAGTNKLAATGFDLTNIAALILVVSVLAAALVWRLSLRHGTSKKN